jgi:tetratricopeptide (TPR) repeat protein
MRNHFRCDLASSPRLFCLAAAVLAAALIILPRSAAQASRIDPVELDNPTNAAVQTELGRVRGARLRVTVLTADQKPLDRQSVVKLYSETKKTTIWLATSGHSDVEFTGLAAGKYEIEASSVGYFSARKPVELGNLQGTLEVAVVVQRDPSAIDLDATDSLMSPGATKEMKHAVKALKSGDLDKAQKYLAATYKLAPSSAPLHFLFGYLSFQKKDFPQAETYLTQATRFDPNYGEALTLLGRVQLLRGEHEQARMTMEEAVAVDPNSWMAHNLLAGVYLQQREYAKAQQQAQLAIDRGQQAATGAQFVLGVSLAYLGKTQEAIRVLKTFLQAAPRGDSASQAQQFIAALEKAPRVVELVPATPNTGSSATSTSTLLADARALLPESAWQPPGIDHAKPAVANGVPCPDEKVADEAGRRVEQLVNDVGRFAAVEDLLHERLDEMGNPTSKENRKFDYTATISKGKALGIMEVDEYRTQRYGVEGLPDHIADNGFAAWALVFHPTMRDAFQMTCEGLGEWRGRATWLVHFQQRSDQPNHIHGYVVGSRIYPVDIKGRAWITADNFQVVRIESEMIRPLPEIQLLAEHQITEYGPVPFAAKNLELWLPKSVEVYLHFRGHRYYRRHTFEKFMLFSVDSEQKVRQPEPDSHGPR